MNDTPTPPVILTIAQSDAQKVYDAINQMFGQISAACDQLSKVVGLLVAAKESNQTAAQKFDASLKPLAPTAPLPAVAPPKSTKPRRAPTPNPFRQQRRALG